MAHFVLNQQQIIRIEVQGSETSIELIHQLLVPIQSYNTGRTFIQHKRVLGHLEACVDEMNKEYPITQNGSKNQTGEAKKQLLSIFYQV